MQELSEVDWRFWIPIIISIVSLIISLAAYYVTQTAEKTRKKEMMIKALTQSHTLLEETVVMHPPLDSPVGFVMDYKKMPEEINNRANELYRLSWFCRDTGDEIRQAVSLMRSLVRSPFAADKAYLSNAERKAIVEKIAGIRDSISRTITALHQ